MAVGGVGVGIGPVATLPESPPRVATAPPASGPPFAYGTAVSGVWPGRLDTRPPSSPDVPGRFALPASGPASTTSAGALVDVLPPHAAASPVRTEHEAQRATKEMGVFIGGAK